MARESGTIARVAAKKLGAALIVVSLLCVPWGLLQWLALRPVKSDLAHGSWWPLWPLLVVALFVAGYEFVFISVVRCMFAIDNGRSYCLDSGKVLSRYPSDPSDNERFKRLTFIVDRLQSRIREEYADVTSRTGWLLAGEGFLLAAFISVLNADRLTCEAKRGFSTGIGLAGCLVSCVLGLSILFGHALAEALKRPRDEAEDLAQALFGVPRAGVPKERLAHTYSHYGSRYIPSLCYIAWVGLTLIVRDAEPGKSGAFGILSCNPGPRGWTVLEPSPAFATGAAKFGAAIPGCPPPTITSDAAKIWIEGIVTKWKGREAPSATDIVILVGSADRVGLRPILRRRYDANVGLARSRAEEVSGMLAKATEKEEIAHRLTKQRIMVLVTGPRDPDYPNVSSLGSNGNCQDPRLERDRKVEVWIPASGSKPEQLGITSSAP